MCISIYYVYACCCTRALFLSLGRKQNFPGNTTLLGDFSHPFFVWCFQMARIILNIEMDVDFEPNLLNNRILFHVSRFWHVLMQPRMALLLLFLASSSDIFYSMILWVVLRSGRDVLQHRASFFYILVMYYLSYFIHPMIQWQ